MSEDPTVRRPEKYLVVMRLPNISDLFFSLQQSLRRVEAMVNLPIFGNAIIKITVKAITRVSDVNKIFGVEVDLGTSDSGENVVVARSLGLGSAEIIRLYGCFDYGFGQSWLAVKEE